MGALFRSPVDGSRDEDDEDADDPDDPADETEPDDKDIDEEVDADDDPAANDEHADADVDPDVVADDDPEPDSIEELADSPSNTLSQAAVIVISRALRYSQQYLCHACDPSRWTRRITRCRSTST